VTENDSVRNRVLSIHVRLFNEDPRKKDVVIPGTRNARDARDPIIT
jgi:hypothetical protein